MARLTPNIYLIGIAFLASGLMNLEATAAMRHFLVAPDTIIIPKTQKEAKIGSQLLNLYNEFKQFHDQFGLQAARQFKPRNRLIKVFKGRVAIEALAADDPHRLERDLQQLDLQNIKRYQKYISGRLPIKALIKIAGLDSLRFARPAIYVTHSGTVQSQGDRAMRADLARSLFGVDGTGIKIGTLSDSFDCLNQAASDVTNGDLPAGIEVLDDTACPTGSDEGRAMMQLIADIAPGADQAFHTADGGQAAFAQGILDLADAGCDIIVDDVIYLAEPMFQDGVVSQAVNSVVARGVAYFSSAGNADRRSYESAFSPSGINITIGGTSFGEAHDYDPGPNVDIYQEITIPGNTTLVISFQWDSPSYSVSGGPGSPNDMDIFLVNSGGTSVLAGSTYTNTGGDPVEAFRYTNPNAQSERFNLLITKYRGSAPGLLKTVIIKSATTFNQYDTSSSTLFGHANAEGAAAVAAAFYEDTPAYGTSPAIVESFSSAGGVPILFDLNGNRYTTPRVRQKPEITAPDGTNTTFFGSADIEPDGFPNFFGTSAAAPHAAAVAALVLEADTTLAPEEIYLAMTQTAFDMDDPWTPGFNAGFDFATGWGLIQADQAVGFGMNVLYVAQDGVCGGKTPCFRRIQAAIDAVTTDQAIINISSQTYREDLLMDDPDTTITLKGGWATDFRSRPSVTTVTGSLEIAGGSIEPEGIALR